MYISLQRCLAGLPGYFLYQARYEVTGQRGSQAGLEFTGMFDGDLEVCGTLNPVQLMQVVRQHTGIEQPMAELRKSLDIVIDVAQQDRLVEQRDTCDPQFVQGGYDTVIDFV